MTSAERGARGGWPRASLLLVALAACKVQFADPSREFAAPIDTDATQTLPDVVHRPDPMGVWNAPLADLTDHPDLPKRAACVTCHGPNPKTFGTALAVQRPGERFHKNIELHHGTLNCNQCHDPADRTKLHLADGTDLDFSEVIKLCGQCHGPQYRDFQHGAHGGKNGYWDAHVGASVRNNCIDCHTPHAPAFKSVMSVFPPRDRYLQPVDDDGTGDADAKGGE